MENTEYTIVFLRDLTYEWAAHYLVPGNWSRFNKSYYYDLDEHPEGHQLFSKLNMDNVSGMTMKELAEFRKNSDIIFHNCEIIDDGRR